MSTATNVPAGGRLVAWVGFVFGSVMSVAANVLHAWLPADEMPEGWHPEVAQQVGAAVWPVALLISVEVLSRVNWKSGFGWKLVRFGGAGVVAAASAVISYGHLHDVLVEWDYTWIGAVAGPLVLDGLMVVSGFALLSMSGSHQEATTSKTVADAWVEKATTEKPSETTPIHSETVVQTPAPATPPQKKWSDNEILLYLIDHPQLSRKRNDIMSQFKVGTTRAKNIADTLEEATTADKM